MGGGKDFDGQRARTPDEQTALNQYSDRFRDYCNQGDPMCAVGSTPVSVYAHLSYFVEHGEEVAEWVAGKVAQSNDKVSSPPGQVSSGTNHPSSPVTPLSLSRRYLLRYLPRHPLQRLSRHPLQQPPQLSHPRLDQRLALPVLNQYKAEQWAQVQPPPCVLLLAMRYLWLLGSFSRSSYDYNLTTILHISFGVWDIERNNSDKISDMSVGHPKLGRSMVMHTQLSVSGWSNL
jgi:hypothetical protein